MSVTAGGPSTVDPATDVDAGEGTGSDLVDLREPGSVEEVVSRAFAREALAGDHRAIGLARVGVGARSSEARVLDATVRCASRWGMQKTTVDDIAREAGVSRATVYRLFPGGKDSIARLAARVETAAALSEMCGSLERAATLEDALVTMVSSGSAVMAGHPALAYFRAHDPAVIRTFLAFDRIEQLFDSTATVLGPAFERFMSPEQARSTVVWVARIVVSHYRWPDPANPLTDPEVARRLVRTFVMPGLAPAPSSPECA